MHRIHRIHNSEQRTNRNKEEQKNIKLFYETK